MVDLFSTINRKFNILVTVKICTINTISGDDESSVSTKGPVVITKGPVVISQMLVAYLTSLNMLHCLNDTKAMLQNSTQLNVGW